MMMMVISLTNAHILPATEATRWIVNHAFTQLDTHRVSLFVLADNPRAISVYRKVYVDLYALI
jgi:hypothetical protein